MGGKASSSNDQMIAFQRQQAREARQKEEERQARLEQGTSAINSAWGGIDQPFYDKYQTALLDYQMPQLEQQYGTAKDKLTYDLARAGTLRSTAAADAAGHLAQEKLTTEAGLRAKADADTAALKQSFSNQKSQAVNQLYSTEDPTQAANLATSQVANAQLTRPNLDPLGALFTPIAVGGIQAANTGYDNYLWNQGMLKGRNYVGSGSLSNVG